jgi:hypothetical protein
MTIGELIQELLMNSDLSNQQIADKVIQQFPSAKTTAKSVASIASVARKYGVNIAKRPSANPSERIAELQAQLDEANRELKVLRYLNIRRERIAA